MLAFDPSNRPYCCWPRSRRVPVSHAALYGASAKNTFWTATAFVLFASVWAGAAFGQSEASPQAPPSEPAPQAVQQMGTAVMIPSATEAPPEYPVGAGDVLGITVYNMPELSRTTVLGSGGTLQLSYFPRPLKVDGETAQQIGQQVAAELKRLQILFYPQVSVAVIKVASKPVVVGGDVRNPRVLQEIRPFTLLQALMLAGGPQSGASDSVLVTRIDKSGKVVSFDLQISKVMSGTDANSNIAIEPGDSIQVLPGQKVFVAGAVKSPGAFDLGNDQQLSVAKLMALVGGWKPDSSPTKAVIVRQAPNGQRQTLPVNLRKIMDRKEQDVALLPNDLLYVPGSTAKTVGLAAVRGVGGAAMYGMGYLIIHR